MQEPEPVVFCSVCHKRAIKRTYGYVCPNCNKRLCPKDGNRIDDISQTCAKCGWIDPKYSKWEKIRKTSQESQKSETELLQPTSSSDIFKPQQPATTSETKPRYICPRCRTTVDYARGRCPNRLSCGYFGRMQVAETTKAAFDIAIAAGTTPSSTPIPTPSQQEEIERRDGKKGRGFQSAKEPRLYKEKVYPDAEPIGWEMPSARRFWRPILVILLLAIGGFFLVRNAIWPAISQPGSVTSSTNSIATQTQAYILINNVSPKEGGQISASPEKEMFAPDTEVTLTAAPARDYTFDHWEVESNNSGSSATISLTMNSNINVVAYFKAKDTTPPVISNVEIQKFSDIYAIITWQTDELATSQIEYGITNAYGSNTPEDETLTTTSHSVTLAELNPDTTYYFRVKSKDSSGNEATSSDTETFRTCAAVPTGYLIGNRAPDFILPYWKDPDPREQTPNTGGQFILSNYLGKNVLLNFWTTRCGACIGELPLIREIYEEQGRNSGSLVVITICLDREETNRIKKLEEKFLDEGLIWTFPVLLDKENITSDAYNVQAYPKTILIDSDGIIQKTKSGRFKYKAEIESFIKSP